MKEKTHFILSDTFVNLKIIFVDFLFITILELDFLNIYIITWTVLIYFPDTFMFVWLKIKFLAPEMKSNWFLQKTQACKAWAWHCQFIIIAFFWNLMGIKRKKSNQSLDLRIIAFHHFTQKTILSGGEKWSTFFFDSLPILSKYNNYF